jgi:hypothetical protein
MIPNLKLKWDALGGKTIHHSAYVLVGFMWSLSVLKWLLSLWIDWLSSSTMFSKKRWRFPWKSTIQPTWPNFHASVERKEKKKEKGKQD